MTTKTAFVLFQGEKSYRGTVDSLPDGFYEDQDSLAYEVIDQIIERDNLPFTSKEVDRFNFFTPNKGGDTDV